MSALIYFFKILLLSTQLEYCSNEPIEVTVNIIADSSRTEETLMYQNELLNYQKSTDKISDETYNQRIKELADYDQNFIISDETNWKKKVFIEVFNANEKRWTGLSVPIYTLDNKVIVKFINIEKNKNYFVDLGIDPEDVEKLAVGKYNIRANLVVRNIEKNRLDTVTTEPFTIQLTAERKTIDNPRHVKKLCIYYSRRGMYEKAMEYARMFNEKDHSIEGNILLGQVFEEMGDYDNALKSFITAKGEVKNLPHQYNEYLDSKIRGILSISPESFTKHLVKGVE